MSYIDANKWTCPACATTVTFEGSPDYIAASKRAEQKRHAKLHRDAEAFERKVRNLDPNRSLHSQGAA